MKEKNMRKYYQNKLVFNNIPMVWGIIYITIMSSIYKNWFTYKYHPIVSLSAWPAALKWHISIRNINFIPVSTGCFAPPDKSLAFLKNFGRTGSTRFL